MEGWIGRRIEEVLPSEAVATLLPRYEAALRGAVQAFQHSSHDGTRIYSVQLVPVPGAGGAISSVVAVMQDITDQLRMTSDLARSESRLRDAERMVGAGLGERCVREGTVSVGYRIVLPSGITRILALQAAAILRPDGRRPHLRGAVLDVTAERKADCQRLAAEHLFREGVDTSPIGTALTDPVEGRCLQATTPCAGSWGAPGRRSSAVPSWPWPRTRTSRSCAATAASPGAAGLGAGAP